MSKDAYHEVFLHWVWHTKESRPLIESAMKQPLYDIIRRRAIQLGGVYVHAIGGTANHVHLVVRANPSLPMAEWLGRVKGGSSHDLNQDTRWRGRLYWQDGYGLVTFGMNDLPWVVAYVKNQKGHHRKGSVFERLERFDAPEPPKEEDGSSQEPKPGEQG